MSKYTTTPIVDEISAANIYVDPAIWSKIIVHPVSKKPNWLAITLFARILYWYTRSEVRDENTGKFLGYKKKFKYDMLQLSYDSIMEQMGCTYKEARLALQCLVAAKIIHKEIRNLEWQGNVMFIEPVPVHILCIINPKGVHKQTPLPLEGQTLCTPRDTPSVPPGTEPTLCSTLCSPLSSTKQLSRGAPFVDNPGGLPTKAPPPKQQLIYKNNKQERERQQKQFDQLMIRATKALSIPKHLRPSKGGRDYDL